MRKYLCKGFGDLMEKLDGSMVFKLLVLCQDFAFA